MDEKDFLRAYNNCRTLIATMRESGNTPVVTHTCNALLTMLAMIDDLNQRVTELQTTEEDDC